MKEKLLHDFKQRLLERSAVVTADIRRELAKADEEHYSMLAGRIADAGEQSVADLLVDVNLAEITRDVNELRDLEAALARIEAGTYGVCADCGTDIERHRLEAVPAARRCYRCQSAFERKDQREHHRTL